MTEIWEMMVDVVTGERALAILRGLAFLIVGLLVAKLLSGALGKILKTRASAQHTMVAKRISFYLLAAFVVLTALLQMGFDLSILLGAAGILTVALGFASQTSASNLISGLFLMGERPFVVGDLIRVGSTTGYVVSLDLMSIKLRTFDNLYVRVPNENILKAEITNFTHFPIRRFDMKLGVAHREDIGKVRRVLLEVADANPLCLTEPEPAFYVLGFGESALNIQFSVWADQVTYWDLHKTLYEEVKSAFDANDIEIPFPHRTLYAGSRTEPLPVKVVEGAPGLEDE